MSAAFRVLQVAPEASPSVETGRLGEVATRADHAAPAPARARLYRELVAELRRSAERV